VAIDGKSSRGNGSADAPAVHLLSPLDQHTGCVPAQARFPAETDEHKAALALLRGMALECRVITGDAAFCQRDLCRQVVADGGHYQIKVDANKPTLPADIATALVPSLSRIRPVPGGRRGDDAGQPRPDKVTNVAAGLRRNAARVRDLLVSLRIRVHPVDRIFQLGRHSWAGAGAS
jgi:hypothetical protein